MASFNLGYIDIKPNRENKHNLNVEV